MIKIVNLKIKVNVPKILSKKVTNEGLKNTLKSFLENEVIWVGSNFDDQIGMKIEKIL
jgi:hypothetical protein